MAWKGAPASPMSISHRGGRGPSIEDNCIDSINLPSPAISQPDCVACTFGSRYHAAQGKASFTGLRDVRSSKGPIISSNGRSYSIYHGTVYRYCSDCCWRQAGDGRGAADNGRRLQRIRPSWSTDRRVVSSPRRHLSLLCRTLPRPVWEGKAGWRGVSVVAARRSTQSLPPVSTSVLVLDLHPFLPIFLQTPKS